MKLKALFVLSLFSVSSFAASLQRIVQPITSYEVTSITKTEISGPPQAPVFLLEGVLQAYGFFASYLADSPDKVAVFLAHQPNQTLFRVVRSFALRFVRTELALEPILGFPKQGLGTHATGTIQKFSLALRLPVPNTTGLPALRLYLPGGLSAQETPPFVEIVWNAAESKWGVSYGAGPAAPTGAGLPTFRPRAFFAANFTAEPRLANLEIKNREHEFKVSPKPKRLPVPYFSFDVKLKRQTCLAKKLSDEIAVSLVNADQLALGEAFAVEKETAVGAVSHYVLDPLGVDCTVAKDSESWHVETAAPFMKSVYDVVNGRAAEISFASLDFMGAYQDTGYFKGRTLHQVTAYPRGNPKVLSASYHAGGALAHPFLK